MYRCGIATNQITLGKDLAGIYAKLQCHAELEQVLTQAKTPQAKDDQILRAIRGFAFSVAD